jgi:hypothetical protein
MSFREKSAWISLVCLILTFGHFFAYAIFGRVPEEEPFAVLHYFLLSAVAFVVLQIILQVINAAISPKDAKAPVDERERLILLRAGRNAHVTLIIGVLTVPVSMHLGGHFHDLHDLGYIAMAALVVSEMVRSASQIIYFRLGR